jgi:hypothetical protein
MHGPVFAIQTASQTNLVETLAPSIDHTNINWWKRQQPLDSTPRLVPE